MLQWNEIGWRSRSSLHSTLVWHRFGRDRWVYVWHCPSSFRSSKTRGLDRWIRRPLVWYYLFEQPATVSFIDRCHRKGEELTARLMERSIVSLGILFLRHSSKVALKIALYCGSITLPFSRINKKKLFSRDVLGVADGSITKAFALRIETYVRRIEATIFDESLPITRPFSWSLADLVLAMFCQWAWPAWRRESSTHIAQENRSSCFLLVYVHWMVSRANNDLVLK